MPSLRIPHSPLTQWPLAHKILLVTGLMASMALGTAWHTTGVLWETNERYNALLESDSRAAVMMARLNTTLQNYARLLWRAVAAEGLGDPAAMRRELDAARREMAERLALSETMLGPQATRLAAFRATEARARPVIAEAERLAFSGQGEAARRLLVQQYDALSLEMRLQIRAVFEQTQKEMDSAAAQLTGTTRDTYWQALLTAAGGTLLATAFALWLMAAGVARPIGRITTRMRALAAGDKDSPVPGAERRDEVGSMAAALESFRRAALEQDRLAAEATAEQEARIRRAAQLEKMVRAFEHETSAPLREVGQAALTLDRMAEEMQTTTDNGTQRAKVLATASQQANAHVQSVAASTEQMAASVAEVARQLAESARIARQAADNAEATDTTVGSLAEAANRIGEVVRLISDIASQTNLLALNATIEAARAGEAGKGFAVVASEVKALANQTAQATEQINAQILGMQGETQQAVRAIREIGGTISSMNNITGQIAAAAEEQAAATQEIGRAVSDAASGTREVNSHAVELSAGVQQAGQAARRVREASATLNRTTGQLRQQIDGFLSGLRAA
ncbi:methyl-accepting chemotaxis protein [Roseomonas sp. GC11]|uniref:methyl-accepting chemotaxis protein n=1 Tax=Roseomonas sp. GC11 TaxID=2950546 RepID=UPI00210D5EB3|nr:methyl-accepting chemotaxis protein [Roseomonas sp. GC11]MCQ4159812.1 methyl-accepting chemotaxis protein [Roseomonas sp. GC11]